MAGEWPEVELGAVLDVKHGYAFKGKHFGLGERLRVVTPGNFLETGGFVDRGLAQKTYDGPVPDGYILEPGSLVVAMTEQAPGLLGASGLIPDDQQVWLHNQRIGLVRPTRDAVADPRYLYYLFNTSAVRAQINATATGTKVRHTAPERVCAVRVCLPSLGEQRRIAGVLGAFDELVDINERRIALLENLARSLYREWFVRFRFPDHEDVELVDSELGPIPATWRVSRLDEVATIVMGQSPKSEHYNDAGRGLPFHQGVTDYGRLIPTHRKFCTLEPRVAESGDVLCSVRAPVGRLNLADRRLVIGRGLAAIRRHDLLAAFALEQIRTALGAEDSLGGGTIYKAVSKGELSSVPVVEPAEDLRSRFGATAEPMLDERVALILTNRALAKTRDLLLPRLVSGRLDISEVDLGALMPSEAA